MISEAPGSGGTRRPGEGSAAMGQTVAFVGMGLMGSRMAKNVLKAGHALRVYNRTTAKSEELQKLGATIAASPREAAQGADAVITMVADPPALRTVLAGVEGAFAGCRQGTMVIDMSTVDPETSRGMAAEAQARGLRYLEAPVTGGLGAAEQGTLLIMAGGRMEDFQAAKPLLETMGKKVLRVGQMGSGAAMKLTTNMVASSISAAMAEALVFAAKAGLEPFLVAEVLADRSPLIARWAPRVLAGEFSPFFPLRLAHKDVHL
ncbi:MAG TPA: NAD(P)-dependent oxidoreductase, partial [Candidatus Methylomirabilis sp.]|nr:NAD(P)-dependent oxidoreductase [Candidatus Methylomirabilis sp.]